MKIAIDCRLIGQSGIGTFIENILHYMILDFTNQYLLIGKEQALAKYSQQKNCQCINCTYASFSIKELIAFPVKAVNQCDAFYTPNFNIPLGINVPTYSTIHDIVFFDTDNFCSPAKLLIYKWFVKRALRISTKVFTVSNFSRERIHNYFNTSKDIEVIYNGINQELRNYKKAHMSENRKKGIVFLGNLKRHKGIHLLLEAYNKLQEEKEDIPLTIIGNFNFRTKDTEIINLLQNNNSKINFMTNASNQEVYDIISKSEVLVSPSYYEGFGIPPLEAMYLNTNVIISDINVYKEIYKDYPVTFFKSGDSKSLYQALRDFSYTAINVEAKINNQYNYELTAKAVLNNITSK